MTGLPAPRPVITVTGPADHQSLGVTDAHNHVWIDPPPGADPSSPALTDWDAILTELAAYRQAGGGALLDCQPGQCGRNGNRLRRLSEESGVKIIAAAGFHRRKYYPAGAPVWDYDADRTAAYIIGELTEGLEETRDSPQPVRAGFIKLALEASLETSPLSHLQGAAAAAAQTGALVELHTEKGAAAEDAAAFFARHGVPASRLVLCHIDKRPDFGLHAELAKAGALLEYDTFYRPKYDPQKHLWPMIEKMAAAGLAGSVVLATDMAEAELYASLGGGPGLASLPGQITARLQQMGLDKNLIRQMTGGNIARRLAGLN